MSGLRALLVISALVTACAARRPDAGLPPELTERARAHPEDGSLRYVMAILDERAGRPDRALARLRELLDLPWDYALDDRDFPKARALPGYAEIAAALARRQPKVLGGEVVRELAERELRPEGIAWDAEARGFYLGDAPRRGVMFAPLEGDVRPLAVPGPGDMFSPLGMHVDPATRTLWVASVAMPMMNGYTAAAAGRSRLVAIDLASGAARVSLPLGDPKDPSLLNDVAPLPGGRVVVTDSQRGALYAADLEATALRALAPPGSFESPNGIAAADDGATLFVADLYGLSAVDPTTGQIRRFQTPPGAYLGGVDGLSLASDRLVGVQNVFGAARIWSVAADPAAPGAPRLLSVGDPRVGTPTTAAVAEGALWLIANPQLSSTDDAGRPLPREQLEDLRLLRIPL